MKRMGFAGLVVVTSLLALLGIWASSASALSSYTFSNSFSAGEDPIKPFGACAVHDLDIDAEENLYALCGGLENAHISAGTVVKKWDKNGNPLPFSGSYPWISGNVITYDPDPQAPERTENGGYGHTFSSAYQSIVVDRSNGPTRGYIYVCRNDYVGIQVFDPTGKWLGAIKADGAAAVDGSGNIYADNDTEVRFYDTAGTFVKTYFSNEGGGEYTNLFGSEGMAIENSTGSAWGIGQARQGFPPGSINKFEASAFGPPEIESAFSFGHHPKGPLSPYVEAPMKGFGGTSPLSALSLEVDQQDNTLFVMPSSSPRAIVPFSPGTPTEKAHQIGESIGSGSLLTSPRSEGLAIGETSHALYVASGANVAKFVPGPPVPTVRVTAPQETDVGHTTATLRAKIELAGGSPITSCEVRYGLTAAYGLNAPCTPDPASAPPGSNFTDDTQVTASLTGLNTNSTYHYAFVGGNASGKGLAIDRTFTPAAILRVKTAPATEVTDSSATLNGSFDPDGIPTTYYFKYGLAGDYTQKTPPVAPVSSTGDLAISIPVSGLRANALYHYRLVATNGLGVTQGPDQSFRVTGPPTVTGLRATSIGATHADLNARINDEGASTSYQFEYGTSDEYGAVVPAEPGDSGEETTSQLFTQHVEGLQPGITYHFRVKATNKWGTTTTPDTTFHFYPQSCPNEHVRQQDKSSSLPDCRAYELVSPRSAGGVQIFPGNELYNAGAFAEPTKQFGIKQMIQNTGLAQAPARFVYYGGLGAVTGVDAPNTGLDSYLATRTNNGWVTTFPGLKGNEGGLTGRRMCAQSLSFCIDHTSDRYGETPENQAYLFGADGAELGELPTNVKSIENGEKFVGDSRPSPDFSHFIFSSNNVIFAPGGTTSAPGSAYDNNLADKSVTTISRLPNGEPIGHDSANAQEFITLPPGGVSTNGSHVLMQTEASDGPNHLYLRVDDSITYDIANGAGVRLVGMTADGSSVTFIASQRLVAEDTDHSADLYRWDENGGSPTLTILSQGNGQGNTDECTASWTGLCSVTALSTQRGDRSGYLPTQYLKATLPGPDSKIASENGAVYFFSPENLAGDAPLNGKNLYLARDGEIKYIGTLAASTGIDRIQISPDGAHAGFLTRGQLTSYDNAGFEEMYAYDAEDESLRCASCLPSGETPNFDVAASQNGPFMTDDGRVFFTTSDPLVPGDVDPAGLPDVYEFVEGRPQLISSGVAINARASGGANFFTTETLGLESVSANGNDVFFSTTDSLVPQDENGQFVKIYDARTNGGFEPEEAPAPCVAADECHTEGAATPGPIQVGTGSQATGGNHVAEKPKRHRHKKTCRRVKHGKRHHKKTCSKNKKRSSR